ncbi:transposase [Bradyrhizobium sp. 186]|nr:transposase [Bradyrhizobium sp. 186]
MLSFIPGIGPITATALAATAPDPNMFSARREFAAWHGPTPKHNSTGGKDRFADNETDDPISGSSLSSKRRSVVW